MLLPDLEDDIEQEVEEVKDQANIKGQLYYLVKQEGWLIEYNQQVPEEDIGNAKQAIQRYKRLKESKKRESKKGVPLA